MSCLLICRFCDECWKQKKIFCWYFHSLRWASFETHSNISEIFIESKKKHQQKSRKCAMSNRWMRAHPLKHKHNDRKCPNIKMWIDINNQDGCVRLISTKSDPNVNKQVCGIIRMGKNYFFGKLLIFFVLYQMKKRYLCCLLVILPPPVSFPGKQNFLIFFLCCCWWRKSFYFHFNAHPFIFLHSQSDFDVKIFFLYSHKSSKASTFFLENVFNNY